MIKIMFSFLLIMSLLFPQFYHPLILLLILLLTSFILALLMGMILPSFWMSYILFLVYLGGLLILFTYVITLIPNEPFNKIFINPVYFLPVFLLLPFMPNILDSSFLSYNNSLISMKKMFFLSSVNLTFSLISFLLFILLVVVKITTYKEGPLRMS